MRAKVAQIGLDSHRTFSNATARDGEGRVMWRQRLEHADRPDTRTRHTLACYTGIAD